MCICGNVLLEWFYALQNKNLMQFSIIDMTATYLGMISPLLIKSGLAVKLDM